MSANFTGQYKTCTNFQGKPLCQSHKTAHNDSLMMINENLVLIRKKGLTPKI